MGLRHKKELTDFLVPLDKMSKEEQEKGCWIWNDRTDAYGHPYCSNFSKIVGLGSMPGKIERPRYIIYKKAKGLQADRLVASCGNELCINPAHLNARAVVRFEDRKKAQDKAKRISYLNLLIDNLKDFQDEDSRIALRNAMNELDFIEGKVTVEPKIILGGQDDK